MPQTKQGGQKALATMRDRYGVTADGKSLHHVLNGAKGGRKSRGGGVYEDSERAKYIGAMGGRLGKRGYKFLYEKKGYGYYDNIATDEIEIFKLS